MCSFKKETRHDEKRFHEDKIRRDKENEFFMEEKDALVKNKMCAPDEIIRQTTLIDKNTKMRRLEREKDEVEELVLEHLSNSSATNLDTGNTQGLVPEVHSCHVEETNDSNQSEEKEHNVSDVQRSENESSKSSSEE